MNTETLKFKIITPMFAGSAIPGMCELRPPSFKGALRFWWRAINAHKDVDALRTEEAKLFGSADEKIGQSAIRLDIRNRLDASFPNFNQKGQKFNVTSKGKPFQVNILDYLAYGCHDYIKGEGVVYNRQCFIPENQNQFEVTFYWDNKEALIALKTSLNALLRFGGIGARSRNGFGKITLAEPNHSFLNGAQELEGLSQALPSYVGFSRNAFIFTSKTSHRSWDKALADIGLKYMYARQGLDQKHFFPNRVFVAQPIIVNKKDVKEMFIDRHAKSLFLSVTENEGDYTGQILLMPYNFLEKIEASSLKTKPAKSIIPELRTSYLKVHDDLRQVFQFQSQMNYQKL